MSKGMKIVFTIVVTCALILLVTMTIMSLIVSYRAVFE